MQSLEGFCEMVVLGKHCLLKGCQLNCEGLIVIVVLHTYGKYFFHMFTTLKKKGLIVRLTKKFEASILFASSYR